MESVPGEDAVKIVEVTIKDSEYCIHVANKAATGFGSIDQFWRSSTVCKGLSKSVATKEKSLVKGGVNSCSKLHLF